MSVRTYLNKRAARKRFKELVPSGVISIVEKDLADGKIGLEVQKRHFQFVLVSLKETAPEDLPALIADVQGTLLSHEAMIFSSTSTVLLAILGAPNPSNDSAEARLRLVGAILAKHGSVVRIAHGECTGMVGNIGKRNQWRYDCIIPNSSAILRKLLDAEFGTAIETH